VWSGRVSPVFDVAREVRIVDIDDERGRLDGLSSRRLPPGRAGTTVADLGVDVLVCSAISPVMEAEMWTAGVEVVADVCGDLEEIVTAIAGGDTELAVFRAPGSPGRERSRGGSAPGPGAAGSSGKG
jgi:predicted Fe-Mo cluster-binding NifX family protein